MYIRLVLPFALLAIVSCKDIEQGQNLTEAHKIYDQRKEASPAVWRQIEKITVNASDEEVISRVVVTDLREGKDGDASIIEGGEGNQTVTIELKSPTVLRGFDFHIEVYAVPKTKDSPDVLIPALVGKDEGKDRLIPKDDDRLRLNIGGFEPAKTFRDDNSSVKPPVRLSTDVKINDGKRVARNPEETKKSETDALKHPIDSAASKHPSESDLVKKSPVHETKVAESHINSTEKDKGNMNNEPSTTTTTTHVPSTASQDLKNVHARHSRDTEKKLHSRDHSTASPSKASKEDDGQEMVYPQWNLDKISGNTDKLLIPDEPKTVHDHKDSKSEKDAHSTTVSSSTTTTSEKPRAVRDTVTTTTPKIDQKDTTGSDQHIQKIPSNGRVTIPEELKNLQDSAVPKIGLNKQSQDGKTPAPYVPKLTIPLEHQARNGPTVSTTTDSSKHESSATFGN